MKGKWSVTILVVVLAVGLTACGAGSTTAPSANPTSGPAASATAEVKISGFAFDPPSLSVVVGTTVTWTNQDSAPHTVTSDAGDWDSGRLSQGQSFSRTFDQAGTFAYHCAVHSSMTGTIVVTQ
jgi:plastocyanin